MGRLLGCLLGRKACALRMVLALRMALAPPIAPALALRFHDLLFVFRHSLT